MIDVIAGILGVSLFLIYSSYYMIAYAYSRKEKSWRNDDFYEEVSLIVPTYNEEATIQIKLKNILEQNYPQDLIELVIIDSGSTDKTVEIIEAFLKEHPDLKAVFLREEERKGKSHAVNIAYKKSAGKIKIISDADSILGNDAITKLVNNFKDPDVGAARGRQILINPEKNATTRLEKSFRGISQVLRRGESNLDSTPIFAGELAAYRANLIEPLPENKSADDSRLANIIRKKGYRAVYDSDALYYEYAPPSFKSRYIQKVRRAQGLIRLFWDFKDVLFRPNYGMYGLLIMPMEFFMHNISPILFTPFLITSLITIIQSRIILWLILGGFLFLVIYLLKLNNKISSLGGNIINFIDYQIILLAAILLCISGRSLHKWPKVEDIRTEWLKDYNKPLNTS